MKPCGNPQCSSSTGICERTTHGHGLLSKHGYWQHPCFTCARHFEKVFGEAQHPHPGESTNPLADEIEKRTCHFCGAEFECFKDDPANTACDKCEESEEIWEFYQY